YGATFTITAAGGPQPPDFCVSVPIVGQGGFLITAQPPSPQPIAPGGPATHKRSVYSGSGVSGPVGLRYSHLENTSIGCSSPTVYPGGFTTMTVTTTSFITPNQYPITITGTSGGSHREATALLSVGTAAPASMLTPFPGTTLSTSPVVFTWDA